MTDADDGQCEVVHACMASRGITWHNKCRREARYPFSHLLESIAFTGKCPNRVLGQVMRPQIRSSRTTVAAYTAPYQPIHPSGR